MFTATDGTQLDVPALHYVADDVPNGMWVQVDTSLASYQANVPDTWQWKFDDSGRLVQVDQAYIDAAAAALNKGYVDAQRATLARGWIYAGTYHNTDILPPEAHGWPGYLFQNRPANVPGDWVLVAGGNTATGSPSGKADFWWVPPTDDVLKPHHETGFFNTETWSSAVHDMKGGLTVIAVAATAGLGAYFAAGAGAAEGTGAAAGATEGGAEAGAAASSEVAASDTLTFTGNVAGEGSVVAPAATETTTTVVTTESGSISSGESIVGDEVGDLSVSSGESVNSLPASDYGTFDAGTTTVATPDTPGVGDAGAFDQYGSVDPGTGQVIGGNGTITYPDDNALPQGFFDQLKSLGTKAASGIVTRLTNSALASGTAANPNLRATATRSSLSGNYLAQKAPSNTLTRFLNPSGNPATQPTQMVYLLVIGLLVMTAGFVFAALARR